MTTLFAGILEADLLLGDVHSLKHKRAVLRPILARLRRMELSVAEVGDLDLHRRALVGVAAVSGTMGHLTDILDSCERQLAGEPEVELLSIRRRIVGSDDQ